MKKIDCRLKRNRNLSSCKRNSNVKLSRNSHKIMKKKNYNPFKMWGSYVGAITFAVLNETTGIFSRCYFNNCAYSLDLFPTGALMSMVEFTIIGFLIGWGIHSLIRKLRN